MSKNFRDVELTSWKSGIGGDEDTYGFRITFSLRDMFYPKENPMWRGLGGRHHVTFLLPTDGEDLVLVTETTDGFWDDCPEYRFTGDAGDQFKEWMRVYGGGLTWSERPHKYKAHAIIEETEKRTMIKVERI